MDSKFVFHTLEILMCNYLVRLEFSPFIGSADLYAVPALGFDERLILLVQLKCLAFLCSKV